MSKDNRQGEFAHFTVELGKPSSIKLYSHGVYQVTVKGDVVVTNGVTIEYFPSILQDVLVLRIPMRYVSIISNIGEESDATKD